MDVPRLHLMPKTVQNRLIGRWGLASRDPHAFLRWFVYSGDQHDALTPVKPFPYNRPHIVALTDLWQREPLLVLVKSRQMMCTWLFVALYLWDAMFNRGRLIMFQSKREDDAIGDDNSGDGLLGRAKFIINHLPGGRWICPKIDFRGTKLVFRDTGSTIWAIPQGADIIRQRTASGILSDEAAFQPEFGDAYSAAIPCITGGGRFTALSTANPGFFKSLYQDTVHERDN